MKASSSEPLPVFVSLPEGAEALNSFPAETATGTAIPEAAAILDFEWPSPSDPAKLASTGQHVRIQATTVAPARRRFWPGVALVAVIVIGSTVWIATRSDLRGPVAIQAGITQTAERSDPAAVPLTTLPLPSEFVRETSVPVPDRPARQGPAAPEPAPRVNGALASTTRQVTAPPATPAAPPIGGRVPASLPAARPIESTSAASSGEPTATPPPAVASGASAAVMPPVAAPDNAAPAPVSNAAPPPSAEASSVGTSLPDLPPASAGVTPAASVAAPAINADEDALRRVLGRYRTAYSELDASAVQAVWPAVDARALARAFNQLENQEVTFNCGLSIAEREAVASCRGGTRYVPKVGNKTVRYDERQWLFKLSKTGNDWTIESVDSRR